MPRHVDALDHSPIEEEQEGRQDLEDFIPEKVPSAKVVASMTSDLKLQLQLSTRRETVQKVCDQQDRLAHEVSEIRYIKTRSQTYEKLKEGQTPIIKPVRQMQDEVKATVPNPKPEFKANAPPQESGGSVAIVDFNAPLSPKLEKMLADYFGVSNKEDEETSPDVDAREAEEEPGTSTKGTTHGPIKAQTLPVDLFVWTRVDCFRLGMVIGALGAIGGVTIAQGAPPGEEVQCWIGFLFMALCVWLLLEKWIDNMGARADMIKYPDRHDW